MKKLIISCSLLLTQTIFGQQNYSQINLNSDSFDEFKILEDTLDDYTVYFTGENHMFASFNTQFEYKFLTYLHQNQGVNHFIFEQSPAVGYIINKIIIEDKSTNLIYLEDIFFEPFYKLVKDLRKYNDTLAIEEKIIIHGIDAERFPYFSVYALDQIVDTLDTRFEGGELFEQIKAFASANYTDYNVATYYGHNDLQFDNFGFGDVNAAATLNSIIEGANAMKDSLMIRLGADGPIFYAIIKSLEVGREWYLAELDGNLKSPIIRERFMCDEFERIYRLYPGAKYYGQFGRCHLHKDKRARECYDYYMNSVANRIAEIEPSLKSKVLVIPIFYSESKEMDGDFFRDMNLDEQFEAEGESFIIDIAYKDGGQNISGFYDQLPFIIICNETPDGYDDVYFTWDVPLVEYHLGAYYGYLYFNKIKKLNTALINGNYIPFTNKFEAYTFAFDYISMNDDGFRGSFTYIPAISNNDRLDLGGYMASVGSYYPFGNRYIMAAAGCDIGYGRMTLKEQTDNTVPNLIQKNGANLNIYTNDILTFDPNLEFRITLPILSFNFKTGYAFDISGKRWKLDGKMKDFTKTSFSFPYIQAGLSLNFKR